MEMCICVKLIQRICSNWSRKIDRSSLVYFQMFLEYIEEGWGPAVLNDQTELDFIREAQRGLSHDKSYWIGGSTNSGPWSFIDLREYRTNDSGNLTPLIDMLCIN